eukprot:c20090_g1_i4.p1 GENE.c20090_g1_i4~~c20090_g1_i4.p1  ORF type:complete len:229 (+),score=59.88 c20090_g1_i4:130-816(+)
MASVASLPATISVFAAEDAFGEQGLLSARRGVVNSRAHGGMIITSQTLRKSRYPKYECQARNVLEMIQRGDEELLVGAVRGRGNDDVAAVVKYGEAAAKQAGGLQDKKIPFLISKAHKNQRKSAQRRHRKLPRLNNHPSDWTTTALANEDVFDGGQNSDVEDMILQEGEQFQHPEHDTDEAFELVFKLVDQLIELGISEAIAWAAVEVVGEQAAFSEALDVALALSNV